MSGSDTGRREPPDRPTAEDVRREHLAEVSVPRQWAYLAGVIGGGLVAMILFIALLGA
jgi:TRAP-type C4-dicarboxylate transport system permease small subunit